MDLADRPLRAFRGDKGLVADDTFVLFYDLDVSPITFDFLWALFIAEMRRIEEGLSSIHVVFVPGGNDGLREEMPTYDRVVDLENRRWRLHHILHAACSLLPSCKGITIAPTRKHADLIRLSSGGRFYPDDYHTALPIAHDSKDGFARLRQGAPLGVLFPPRQALTYIDDWLAKNSKGRRVICITLRNYGYNTARNSNLAAWIEFARSLDPRLYCPVFVTDTDDVMQPPEALAEMTVFPAAALDLHLRSALYQRAWLNMGVSGGPMAMCWFLANCRYAMLKIRVPNAYVSSDEFLLKYGYSPDEDLPGASPYQRWIWKDDTTDVITRVFKELARLLEQDPAQQTTVAEAGDTTT